MSVHETAETRRRRLQVAIFIACQDAGMTVNGAAMAASMAIDEYDKEQIEARSYTSIASSDS